MYRFESERLLYRPPDFGDVPAIATWLGDYDVAKNLATAPHPYCEADARAHVQQSIDAKAKGEGYNFSLLRRTDGVLVGQCGLRLRDGRHRIGYWLGKPFWGQGYATEAAKRVLAFAFRDLKAERVNAGWFADNPASGRVLEKLGFVPDGLFLRASAARGGEVACNEVTLTAEEFRRKKAA